MEEKGSAAKEEEELEWISNSSRNKDQELARPGKRDEWSDGAVTALLDAYEAKWALRNRAKLKGQDWEDVARAVSCRAGKSKGPKTATQCKNKVESMKKRYRSEAAAVAKAAEVGGSKWPLYDRLDSLVRCRAAATVIGAEFEGQHEQLAAAMAPAGGMSPPKANGDAMIVEGECGDTPPAKENQNEANNKEVVLGISTQSNDGSHKKREPAPRKNKKRKNRKEQKDVMSEVIRSIEYFAEVVLKVEQMRMEAMREVEMIRAEAEAKRGEMDLKRTELIANTQLQIARLFAKNCGNI